MTPKLLLTPKEAAEMLGISQDMLVALKVPCAQVCGRGTGVRRHRRYSRPAVLAWLSSQALPTVTTVPSSRGGP